MTLTADDKQWIKGAIVEGVTEAIDVLVAPRLTAIEGRIDSIEERLDSIEERLDSIEARLDSIEKRLDVLESDVREIKNRLGVLESDVREIKEQLGTHDWQIEAMTSDIKELYNEIFKKPNSVLVSKAFEKLSNTDKISVLNQQIIKMAKKLNVELQR